MGNIRGRYLRENCIKDLTNMTGSLGVVKFLPSVDSVTSGKNSIDGQVPEKLKCAIPEKTTKLIDFHKGAPYFDIFYLKSRLLSSHDHLKNHF